MALIASSPAARRQKMTPGGMVASSLPCAVVTAKVPGGSFSRSVGMLLEEARNVDAEIVEGEVGDGDAADRSSRSITASWSLRSCLRRYSRSFIWFPDWCSMMFSSPVAEMSRSTIRPLTRCSRLMYSSSSILGQKLMSWMRSLGRPDAVDPAEPLDDANRVPVDVEVDDGVAVLEVLAFADAVRGDKQIDVAFVSEIRRTFLGPRRKGSDDAGEVLAEARQRGFVVACACDKGRVQTEFFLCPIRKFVIKVMSGIGKGSKDEELAVALVDGLATLALDDFAESGELGVTRRATCLAADNRVSRRLRSSTRSCRQRIRSTSWNSTLTLRPTSRLSNAGSSTSTSSMSISSIARLGLQPRERGLHVGELAGKRKSER